MPWCCMFRAGGGGGGGHAMLGNCLLNIYCARKSSSGAWWLTLIPACTEKEHGIRLKSGVGGPSSAVRADSMSIDLGLMSWLVNPSIVGESLRAVNEGRDSCPGQIVLTRGATQAA